jgi:putative ABC transport system ATP-binding protein
MIQAENLVKQYGNGNTAVYAIEGISFRINSGEFISVMGESGAGKSTLLSIMGAMNAPTSGHLLVDDIDIYGLEQEQRADFRREFLGFVFQSFHLIPYLTVVENVMLPLTTVKTGRSKKRGMALEALSWVGLEGKQNRLPGQISGGEKERVAVARAIVNDPPILLADEPTGNLDTKTSGEIMALLLRLNTEGTTIIMVTHSPECSGYAQRTLHVSDGKLIDSESTVVSKKRQIKREFKE